MYLKPVKAMVHFRCILKFHPKKHKDKNKQVLLPLQIKTPSRTNLWFSSIYSISSSVDLTIVKQWRSARESLILTSYNPWDNLDWYLSVRTRTAVPISSSQLEKVKALNENQDEGEKINPCHWVVPGHLCEMGERWFSGSPGKLREADVSRAILARSI